MPSPAPSIERARSLVSASEGRTRNQLTATRPTHKMSEATIHPSDSSKASS